MKIEVLDYRNYEIGSCYLCKVNLLEYVKSIKVNYRDYEVQRGIVKNSYLDNLYKTIENKGHIPLITLVTEEDLARNSSKILEWDILDGLQRTHRLKVIYDTYILLSSGNLNSTSNVELRDKLAKINSDLRIFNYVNDSLTSGKAVEDFFKKNFLWIEIWKDLDINQQIEKMLLLNAGHKSVSTKHQIEIIFAHLIPKLNKNPNLRNIKILREKDITSASYTKNRKTGEFFFAHIITGTCSFLLGEPVTANATFINKIQNVDEMDESLLSRINGKLINNICEFLVEFDELVSKEYNDEGIKWLGKEVVVNAIFGALGNLAKSPNSHEVLNRFIINFKRHPENLAISKYEKDKQKLDISKVNVGMAQKNVIFDTVIDFMNNPSKKSTWKFG